MNDRETWGRNLGTDGTFPGFPSKKTENIPSAPSFFPFSSRNRSRSPQLSIFSVRDDYRMNGREDERPSGQGCAADSHPKGNERGEENDEIHLFGIHRAGKIRRDDRGRATRNVRRML